MKEDRELFPGRWSRTQPCCTLTVLSTAPEKRRPLETARAVTLPWCLSRVCVQIMLSMLHTYILQTNRLGRVKYQKRLTKKKKHWNESTLVKITHLWHPDDWNIWIESNVCKIGHLPLLCCDLDTVHHYFDLRLAVQINSHTNITRYY